MDAFEVTGGIPLKGEIIPQGAKNEALQVISAVLLTAEKVTISNIPDIKDVNSLIQLLADLGVEIAKINPEKNVRVRIMGRIIDKGDSVIVVDDGSAKADIILDLMPAADIGDFVRVFCRVLPLEEGYELRGEIVQDMNGMDMNLYKKIFEIG